MIDWYRHSQTLSSAKARKAQATTIPIIYQYSLTKWEGPYLTLHILRKWSVIQSYM